MPEPFALTCDSCDEPMLPNLGTADADGCLWICIDPVCPELCAGELETEDLAGGGVSTSWGTGSDVEDQALAARLVWLIDFYDDTIEEPRAKCGGDGEGGVDAGGGAPVWPPPRPFSAPPVTPPPLSTSASPASTPGCLGPAAPVSPAARRSPRW